MDWELRLITREEFIGKRAREGLWASCQRFALHTDLTFTKEEVIGIYGWGLIDKRREIKDIYEDTRRHLSR